MRVCEVLVGHASIGRCGVVREFCADLGTVKASVLYAWVLVAGVLRRFGGAQGGVLMQGRPWAPRFCQTA